MDAKTARDTNQRGEELVNHAASVMGDKFKPNVVVYVYYSKFSAPGYVWNATFATYWRYPRFVFRTKEEAVAKAVALVLRGAAKGITYRRPRWGSP